MGKKLISKILSFLMEVLGGQYFTEQSVSVISKCVLLHGGR